jgi:hypothetical protein
MKVVLVNCLLTAYQDEITSILLASCQPSLLFHPSSGLYLLARQDGSYCIETRQFGCYFLNIDIIICQEVGYHLGDFRVLKTSSEF